MEEGREEGIDKGWLERRLETTSDPFMGVGMPVAMAAVQHQLSIVAAPCRRTNERLEAGEVALPSTIAGPSLL